MVVVAKSSAAFFFLPDCVADPDAEDEDARIDAFGFAAALKHSFTQVACFVNCSFVGSHENVSNTCKSLMLTGSCLSTCSWMRAMMRSAAAFASKTFGACVSEPSSLNCNMYFIWPCTFCKKGLSFVHKKDGLRLLLIALAHSATTLHVLCESRLANMKMVPFFNRSITVATHLGSPRASGVGNSFMIFSSKTDWHPQSAMARNHSASTLKLGPTMHDISSLSSRNASTRSLTPCRLFDNWLFALARQELYSLNKLSSMVKPLVSTPTGCNSSSQNKLSK
mmetsp:Transcript_103768/g.300133  ORF Transcript_103768/g.300133 Transcript_103768/m.300133 type:complete len:280 (+) Transcript_103768:216-1055(+)